MSIDQIIGKENDLANKIATMQTHVVDGAYLGHPGEMHATINKNDLLYSGRKINYKTAEEFARKYMLNPLEEFELKIVAALGDNYKKAPRAIKLIFEKTNDKYFQMPGEAYT